MTGCPACGAAPTAAADAVLVDCAGCRARLRVDRGEVELLPRWRADCPCPKRRCERHGHCQDCHAHHHARRRQLPRCLRG